LKLEGRRREKKRKNEREEGDLRKGKGRMSVKPRIFVENPNLCTIAIVPGSVAIAYRTSHR
jgi:hypothetical protein